jgi:hypothetical protein
VCSGITIISSSFIFAYCQLGEPLLKRETFPFVFYTIRQKTMSIVYRNNNNRQFTLKTVDFPFYRRHAFFVIRFLSYRFFLICTIHRKIIFEITHFSLTFSFRYFIYAKIMGTRSPLPYNLKYYPMIM